jgi:hypothetical protein
MCIELQEIFDDRRLSGPCQGQPYGTRSSTICVQM